MEDCTFKATLEKYLLKASAMSFGFVRVFLPSVIELGELWEDCFKVIILLIPFHVDFKSFIFSLKKQVKYSCLVYFIKVDKRFL